MKTDDLRINATAETLKWKEAASRELFAMGEEERFAFLRTETEKLRARLAAFHAKHEPALAH